MVTYIDNKNSLQYHRLFQKATNLLQEQKPSGISDSLEELHLTWDDFFIGSLNEYYSYLGEIVAAASDTLEKQFYLRLPLDEEFFEINADTRTIKVPTSFANNGVGVQGDELAEIVYFRINRFFDNKDLANSEINIAIQWEVSRNGERIQGFSRNFGKDIESDPGYIIFGWPISHEFTETPGTIRFAVRFYTINNDTFEYSFSTLPEVVKINASIDYDIISNSQEELNYGEDIIQRVSSSKIYNPSLPTPAMPIIVTPLYAIGNDVSTRIIDLPQEGGVELAISAKPGDSGVIKYIWNYHEYQPNKDTENIFDKYSTVSTNISNIKTPDSNGIVADEATIDYKPVANREIKSEQIYYTKDSNDNYMPINDNSDIEYAYEVKSIEDDESIPHIIYDLADLGEDEQLEYEGFYYDGSFVTLYEKYGLIKVKKVGLYTADVAATILTNESKNKMSTDEGIIIPGPLPPNIEVQSENITTDNNVTMVHEIINNDSVTLSATVSPGEVGKPPAEVGIILTDPEDPTSLKITTNLHWEYKDNGNWRAVDAEQDSFITLENNELTVSDLNNSTGDYYRLSVESIRNNHSITNYSPEYRVTNEPAAPVTMVRAYNGNGFAWTELNYRSANNRVDSKFNSDIVLRVGVNDNIVSDNLTYIWVQANLNADEVASAQYIADFSEEDIQQNDLIRKINALLNDNNATRDQDDIIKVINKSSDKVVQLSEQDIEEGASNLMDSFNPTETGWYYCVVVNELNNHIAVNISPFFNVTP